jgi:CHAT domain-containing protein/tetratricopeptide (TPR) repeat protein
VRFGSIRLLYAARAVFLTVAIGISATPAPVRAAPGGSRSRPVVAAQGGNDPEALGLAALLARDVAAAEQAPLPKGTSRALSQALASDGTGKFADAVSVLEKRRAGLAKRASQAERRALAIVLADVRYGWGYDEKRRGAVAAAITQFQAAYGSDRLWRRLMAGREAQEVGAILADRDPARALVYEARALALARETADGDEEATAFLNTGNAYLSLSRYNLAVQNFQHALSLFREVGDHRGEASVLGSIGNVYVTLGPYARAIPAFEQALMIYQGADEPDDEATALNEIGYAQERLDRYDLALGSYRRALTLDQEVGDTDAEARALSNLGNASVALSRYETALTYFGQALPLLARQQDPRGEAATLDSMGMTHVGLGQYRQAVAFYERAIRKSQAAQDRDLEAGVWNDEGVACEKLRELPRATSCLQRAYALYARVNDADGRATALLNLGIVDGDLGASASAVSCFQRAQRLFESVGNRDGEGGCLVHLGMAAEEQGKRAQAIAYGESALPLLREAEDAEGEAEALKALMGFWSNAQFTGRNLDLAILWGKQAVNIYQSVRRNVRGLDPQTQRTYVTSKETTYRTLADLLVRQGRLPEAEQVLDLLKRQETLDFVRRDAAFADVLEGDADLNTAERAAYADYQKNADQLAWIEQKKDDLNREIGKSTPASEQTAKLDVLDSHLKNAATVFQKFLDHLPDLFPHRVAGTAGAEAVEAANDSRELTGSLQDLQDETNGQLRPVAVYTLVGPDALSIILVDPDVPTPIAKRVKIQDADLNRLVEQFKAALTNPNADPKPAASKLYDLLIAPIETPLAAARPNVILWSLDGALRYIPMAALWDGKQYLVERYASALFTLKAADKLKDAPRTDGTGLALATTHALSGFPALAGADEEAHLFGKPDGIVPGDRLEDAAFSKDAFFRSLSKDPTTRKVTYSVVHVASHFDLQPAGDANSSFLLLGDGEHLSVSDMQTQSSTLFRGVDLLVLSACNTATAGMMRDAKDADAGGEFEGFSNVLMDMGTGSVLASLWEVSDVGTPPLMHAFYLAREETPPLMTALALQRAQVACLSGAARADETNGAPPERGATLRVRMPGAFTADPARPLAHPYYWAAFVLIGSPR